MLRKIVGGRRQADTEFANRSGMEDEALNSGLVAYGLRNRQMSSDPRKRQIPSSKFIWVRKSG